MAAALRKTQLASLDDLLAVARKFLTLHFSRSGLDGCLRRHGMGTLRDLQVKAALPKQSGFKAYEPGLRPASSSVASLKIHSFWGFASIAKHRDRVGCGAVPAVRSG